MNLCKSFSFVVLVAGSLSSRVTVATTWSLAKIAAEEPDTRGVEWQGYLSREAPTMPLANIKWRPGNGQEAGPPKRSTACQ